MNQVLRRRYGKAIEESKIPDVILIDGGKGQLGQAKAVFESLDVVWDKNHPLLLGWRKGPIVKPGWRHCSSSRKVRALACRRIPGAACDQHIRDESHDHAISGHRKNGRK
jgi:excinuclease ABC subunit C